VVEPQAAGLLAASFTSEGAAPVAQGCRAGSR